MTQSDERNCSECGREWDGDYFDHTALVQGAIDRVTAEARAGVGRAYLLLPPICGTCGQPTESDSR